MSKEFMVPETNKAAASSSDTLVSSSPPNQLAQSTQFNRALRVVVSGATIIFWGLLVGQLLGYLTGALAGRLLGTAQFGVLTLALSIFEISGNLAVLGLPSGIARFASSSARRKADQKIYVTQLAKTALFIALPLSFVMAIVVWGGRFQIARWFEEPMLAYLLALIAWAFPFFIVSQIFSGVLRGKKAMGAFVLCQNILKRASLPLIILFWLAGWQLWGVTLAYALSFIVMAIGAYTLSRRYLLPGISSLWRLPVNLDVLRFSLPLVVSTVILQIGGKVNDVLILGIFQSAEVVGLYAAAQPTASLLRLGFVAMRVISMPVFTELFTAGKHDEMNALYTSVSRWLLYFTLPLFCLMMLFPGTMLTLFGEGYQGATTVLQVLIIGNFVDALAGLSGQILLAMGRTRTHMMLDILFVTANVALNLLLVPHWGAIGAAWATVLAMALWNLSGLIVINRVSRVMPFSWGHVRFSLLIAVTGSAIYFGTRPWGEYVAFTIVTVALGLSTLLFVVKWGPEEDRLLLNRLYRQFNILKV